MANTNLSNRITTVVDNFWTAFTRGDDLARVGQLMRISNLSEASLKVSELRTTGAGGFTDSWNGTSAPTTKDFTAVAGSAVTPAAYAKRMILAKYAAEDDPEILAQIGTKLGNEAQHRLAGLAWTALGGVFTGTNHPTISGKNICDSFTSPVTFDNDGAAALSASALESARAVMREAVNHDGDVVGMPPMNLVVPAELEGTAKKLVFSNQFGTDAGSAMQINSLNPAMNSGIAGVIVGERLNDANDWFLVADANARPDRAFAVLWLRSPIEFIPSMIEATKEWSFHVSFRATVYYPPECELGIYGSSVT